VKQRDNACKNALLQSVQNRSNYDESILKPPPWRGIGSTMATGLAGRKADDLENGRETLMNGAIDRVLDLETGEGIQNGIHRCTGQDHALHLGIGDIRIAEGGGVEVQAARMMNAGSIIIDAGPPGEI